ncbi:peptidyl-prolyl cis-trans isomerase [Bacillus sp. HMF5848]|uniref:peptidyl-prolyl cis-trans isomerase n=1 Tax=Bacillus sp. HMF5848 TaxID=2495421 RepID=UPI000F766DA7|nr:peptidyl-prolyl cis-trans isomerase [Bacillus sp. HMF5848]RSK26892.1 peptidyl-prolyl cis-trans isomerase [Bacillus sp. HMF5848]
MDTLLTIEGNVAFKITLDPGVWVFDDDKKPLESFFEDKNDNNVLTEEKSTPVSRQWQREIQEGSVYPQTFRSETQYKKQQLLEGSLAIEFHRFLRNAEPTSTAKQVHIVTTTETHTVSLRNAFNLIIAFSKNGSPLKEDGPIHVYFHDGSNKEAPITDVRKFIVE